MISPKDALPSMERSIISMEQGITLNWSRTTKRYSLLFCNVSLTSALPWLLTIVLLQGGGGKLVIYGDVIIYTNQQSSFITWVIQVQTIEEHFKSS